MTMWSGAEPAKSLQEHRVPALCSRSIIQNKRCVEKGKRIIQTKKPAVRLARVSKARVWLPPLVMCIHQQKSASGFWQNLDVSLISKRK
jgi:hypothetical protein